MQPQYPGQPAAASPSNPAQLAGIISAVCAVLLLVALFTKGWAHASEGHLSIHAGILGFEGCGEGHCESEGWDKAARQLNIPSDVSGVRILGLLAGLAAVGALATIAGLCLTRNPQKVPVGPLQFVLALASASLTWFAVRLAMSDEDVNFGPSWGAFVGIGAIVVGGIVLRTIVKPLARAGAQPVAGAMPYGQQQPQAMGYPPPPVAAPAGVCPRCNGPIEYVAQYQRYFCRRCNQYV